MIYLLLEMLLIISYLYKNVLLGIVVWIFIMCWQSKRCLSQVDYFVRLIISSIPISYLEINCEIGSHILKWYNFAIIGLVIVIGYYAMKGIVKFRRISLMCFLCIILFQLIRNMFCVELLDAFIELFQEYIIIFPVFLFWNYARNMSDLQCKINVIEWVDLYKHTCFALSIGVIIQFFIYMLTGNIVGYATIWASRQVFDLTFTGYSVLSICLGCAMIISLKDLLEKRNTIYNLIIFSISAIACAINSSRTGFLSAIVIICIMLILKLLDSKDSVRAFFFAIPVVGIAFAAVVYLIQNRGALQNGNILFANGRDTLMYESIEWLTKDVTTFLFGLGINGYVEKGLMAQHNMFTEIWLANGTLIFLLFLGVVFIIVYKTKRLGSRYLLWHLLLSHQFLSSFFASTFIVPIFLILIGEYYLTGSSNEIKD